MVLYPNLTMKVSESETFGEFIHSSHVRVIYLEQLRGMWGMATGDIDSKTPPILIF